MVVVGVGVVVLKAVTRMTLMPSKINALGGKEVGGAFLYRKEGGGGFRR